MGAGASISSETSAYPPAPGYLSANGARLRRAIVMRAYNLQRRQPNAGPITFEEQFKSFAYKKDGWMGPVVCVEDVATALQLPPVTYAAWLREVRRGAGAAEVGGGEEMRTEIDFRRFIDFLETGDLSVLIAIHSHTEGLQRPPERGISNVFSGEGVDFGLPPPGGGASSRREPPPETAAPSAASAWPGNAGSTPRRGMPPTPPRQSRHRESSQDVSIRAVGSPNIYPEVFAALGFICANDDTVVHSLTPSRSQVLVPASPGGAGAGAGGGSSDMGMMPPGKPLWRKREVVRSERIVHYTTVDASGLLQELVEKESTETEVLHMECRETGEFAHRETTKYEQLETFNNEVVTEEKGREEYVHLKSLDDEIEYMESNMPRGRGSGGPPPADGGSYRGDTEGGTEPPEGAGGGRAPAESEAEDGEPRQTHGGYSPPRPRKTGPPPHVVPPHSGERGEEWGEEEDIGPGNEDAIPGYSPGGLDYGGSWRPHEADVSMSAGDGYPVAPTKGPLRDYPYSPTGEEPQSFEGAAPDTFGQTFAGLFDDDQRVLSERDTSSVDIPVPRVPVSAAVANVGGGNFTFADSDIDDEVRNVEVSSNIDAGGDESPTRELRRYGSFEVD